MKNKIKKIVLMILLLMLMQVVVFADTLTIKVKANKEKVNIGDKVEITVSWDKGMQAADFILNYDSEKLEFVKSNLEDDYINNANGKVKTAWFSIDNTDRTEIKYIFIAKKVGIAEVETKVNGGFATGELLMPTGYNEGKLHLEIKEKSLTIKVLIIIVIVVIVLILMLLVMKKLKTEKLRKKY